MIKLYFLYDNLLGAQNELYIVELQSVFVFYFNALLYSSKENQMVFFICRQFLILTHFGGGSDPAIGCHDYPFLLCRPHAPARTDKNARLSKMHFHTIYCDAYASPVFL